ncbi:hypothetical protein FRC17_011315 [Serendipita sp. 399]|nr:hypothetical protein FRC17_011315 [Serendipita sp. 399]
MPTLSGVVGRSLSGPAQDVESSSPFIIFSLERNIRVSQFPTPLPTPLDSYRPLYTTLPDGSLLTSVYKADLFSAHSRLFGVGALLTLGAVNVWTCVSYIRRGKVKDKTLFYLLLASQITGILGLKAYRCLNKSRFILVIVWILQICIFVLFALDIRGIDSPRRISVTYAVWKSSLYPAAQGRLSIAISEKLPVGGEVDPTGLDPNPNTGTIRQRGWWDYVPRAPPSDAGSVRHGPTGQDAAERPSDDSLVKRLRNSVMRLTTSMDISSANLAPQPTYTRKPSIPTEQPLSQPPRPSQHSKQPSQPILNSNDKSRHSQSAPRRSTNSARSEVPPSARTTSVKSINFAASISGMTDRSSRVDPLQPLPLRNEGQEDSVQSALWPEPSKRLPAVLQLRAVIKDECLPPYLIYVRLTIRYCIRSTIEYVGYTGAAISLLVMLTFSRVVRRHERDAILQSPSAFGGLFAANTALARRRRDALAFARTPSIVHSTASETGATKRRKLVRRSSWDYAMSDARMRQGYAASLFDDNASLRRQEGLRAWDEEKERRRRKELELENPFADFHDIAGFEEYDGFGARKSGEGPLGVEEMMLDTESIHRRGLALQQPMVASPWMESPFTYVEAGGSVNLTPNGSEPPRRFGRPNSNSLAPSESGGTLASRRGSDIAVPERAFWNGGEDHERSQYLQQHVSSRVAVAAISGFSPVLGTGLGGPLPGGSGRRGAITTESVPPTTLMVNVPGGLSLLTTPMPRSSSPLQSHTGSSIELLEQRGR